MRKTVAAATMAASLTVGGAVGAALFAPTVVGAQADDTAPTTEQTCDREQHGQRWGDGQRAAGFRGGVAEAVTDVLGLAPDEVRDRLADGQSLADIAAAEGVELQDVVDAIVAQRTERLDAAVEAGRLTEDEAAERAEAMAERVTTMVEHVPALDGSGPRGDGMHRDQGRGQGQQGQGHGMHRGSGPRS